VTDHQLAAQLAEAAGTLLLALRDAGELSGAALGAEGDARANALLMAGLAAARPDDAILSEECECDGKRHGADRVWIIDPLDGTREYADGRDDWAVHVALAIAGEARIGAVAIPALGQVFSTGDPQLVPPNLGTTPRLLVSRSRPVPQAAQVADALRAQLVPMGSAGAKAMAVVRGDGDIYLHSGGQYQWDNAAPVAVAMAHGLHCSRLDGSRLVYNCAEPMLPDLLICRPEWAGAVLSVVNG
jgi:3'(2'), 5'-bisphosphate nucleotidase